MRAPTIVSLLLLGACTVHPEGEDEERARADRVGQPWAKAAEERELPDVAADAPLATFITRAAVANGEVEARFFEWRAALEKIPQVATQPLMLGIGVARMFSPERMRAIDKTTAFVEMDMTEGIQWPGKLASAGAMALADAKAAARRFDQAGAMLAAEVTTLYVDLALADEELRIDERNLALLEAIIRTVESRARVAASSQHDLLKARTELDLARNELEATRSRRGALLAQLNAKVARDSGAPVVARLPEPRALPDDQQLLARLVTHNPDLAARAHEIAARREAVRFARRQYIPDLSISGDVTGTLSRSLGAMVTLPFLRYPIIEGQIAEASAMLSASEAMRRQAERDLVGRAATTLAMLRDADRQAVLFRDVILPRAEQTTELARSTYGVGQLPVIEVIDSQRTQLDAARMLVRMRAEREKAWAELEAMAGGELVPSAK